MPTERRQKKFRYSCAPLNRGSRLFCTTRSSFFCSLNDFGRFVILALFDSNETERDEWKRKNSGMARQF